jgi:hypothetical protein
MSQSQGSTLKNSEGGSGDEAEARNNNNSSPCQKSKYSDDSEEFNQWEGKQLNDQGTSFEEVPSTPPALSVARQVSTATTDKVSLLNLAQDEDVPQRSKAASFDIPREKSVSLNRNSRVSCDGPDWVNGMASSFPGVPVNERPTVRSQGPRMSNAVARKLGLAPNRTSSSSTNGFLSPTRQSIDAGSARTDGFIARTSTGGHSISDQTLNGFDQQFTQLNSLYQDNGTSEISGLGGMWGIQRAETAGSVESLVSSIGAWQVSDRPAGNGRLSFERDSTF